MHLDLLCVLIPAAVLVVARDADHTAGRPLLELASSLCEFGSESFTSPSAGTNVPDLNLRLRPSGSEGEGVVG